MARVMGRIAHLSDLHFGAGDRLGPRIHDGLVQSLRGLKVDALVLTGDVFDTNEPTAQQFDGFLALYERIDAALGGKVPALLLPGNHDRRGAGVFAPWRGGLFEALRDRLASRSHVRVLGNRTPSLAEWTDLPGIDADVVSYDSSYLPRGMLSAGGVIRQEDLIRLADRLRSAQSTRPLLFLVHHHLVPTPVTDTSLIGTDGRPFWQKLFVRELLPDVIGNGDREELTMTALGAGTALTTLHQLGRAVVVMHGHKHYPTARLLRGTASDESDVLLASAGSCGTATSWSGGDFDEAPRLWPSFNLVELSQGQVEVSQVAWSPFEANRRNPPRQLVRVEQRGVRWHCEPQTPPPAPFEPVLSLNHAEYSVAPSQRFLDRFDLTVRRVVEATSAVTMRNYWEVVTGPPDAAVTDVRFGGLPQPDARTPARLGLPLHGESTWRVVGGALSSLSEAQALFGADAAYDWVGLLNRSRSTLARLTLHVGPQQREPFASATDLTTGKERPLALRREAGAVTAELVDCPARTMLRIYWPLVAP